MTFLNTRYRLARPLAARELESLSRLATFYGIRHVSIEEQELVIEYDASRVHEAEVLAEARKLTIPIEPGKPIPPGAFDYSGEFKDFAWPVEGLSPVNSKQK